MNDPEGIDAILNEFDKISREKIKHYSLSFKEYLQFLKPSISKYLDSNNNTLGVLLFLNITERTYNIYAFRL